MTEVLIFSSRIPMDYLTHPALETTALMNRRTQVAKEASAPDICYEFSCRNSGGSELATIAKLLLIKVKNQILPEVVVEGALQKVVEAVEEEVVAAAAQASVKISSFTQL